MTTPNPTQEDIDAAVANVKEDLENLVDGWGFEDIRSIDYEYGTLEITVHDLKTILAALKQYKPVDVEKLYRPFSRNVDDYIQGQEEGWNDCIDHLLEQGVIRGE